MNERISILGCGRWASFHGWFQSIKLHNHVLMWGRGGDGAYLELSQTHKNAYVTLPAAVAFTADLGTALEYADTIIISISAQGFVDLTANIKKHNPKNKIFVLCMKGLDCDTGRRLSEIMAGGVDKTNRICVWVGPGHTQELTAGQPNIMVMAGEDRAVTAGLIKRFSNDLIRFYQSDDLIGTEIGAATKNVIGLAAGFLDGAGMSSLKGALMSRGIYEVSVLTEKLGGNRLTPFGMSHLGDFEATLFNSNSHNRAYGEKYIRAYLAEEKFENDIGVAEGVPTAKAVYDLAKKHKIDMPIITLVYNVLYKNAAPMDELKRLFMRDETKEFRYDE